MQEGIAALRRDDAIRRPVRSAALRRRSQACYLHDVELNDLRYFFAAAAAKSFSQAALDVHVSPAAVSKAVKKLEEEMGAALFVRTTRSVALTDAGAALFLRCKTIFAEIDAAKDDIAELGDGLAGRLRVAAMEVFSMDILPRALASFLQEAPAVVVHCHEMVPARMEQLLLDGKLDVGFTVGGGSSRRIAKTTLGTSPAVVVVGRRHPLYTRAKTKGRVGTAELARHRWVVPRFLGLEHLPPIDQYPDDIVPREAASARTTKRNVSPALSSASAGSMRAPPLTAAKMRTASPSSARNATSIVAPGPSSAAEATTRSSSFDTVSFTTSARVAAGGGLPSSGGHAAVAAVTRRRRTIDERTIARHHRPADVRAPGSSVIAARVSARRRKESGPLRARSSTRTAARSSAPSRGARVHFFAAGAAGGGPAIFAIISPNSFWSCIVLSEAALSFASAAIFFMSCAAAGHPAAAFIASAVLVNDAAVSRYCTASFLVPSISAIAFLSLPAAMNAACASASSAYAFMRSAILAGMPALSATIWPQVFPAPSAHAAVTNEATAADATAMTMVFLMFMEKLLPSCASSNTNSRGRPCTTGPW